MGISRLTVAASNVASATVATVKPGLQARIGGAGRVCVRAALTPARRACCPSSAVNHRRAGGVAALPARRVC
jgi:hypothetical protein